MTATDKLRKLTHDKLGWHYPLEGTEHIPFMDISVNATCRYCGKRILQDSQGGWFLSPVQSRGGNDGG